MVGSSCTSCMSFPRTALPGYSAEPHTVDLYTPSPQTYLSLHPCDQPCKMAQKRSFLLRKGALVHRTIRSTVTMSQLTEGLMNLRHNRSLAFGCASHPTPQPLCPVRDSDLMYAGGVAHYFLPPLPPLPMTYYRTH